MPINCRTKKQTGGCGLSICLALVLGLFSLTPWASPPGAQQENRKLAPRLLVPTAWTPSLEQVQEGVEEGIAAQPQQSQQALNRASQHLADLADARLFITYILLLQKLDEQGRQALFTEQKAWLVQRAASARAAVVSKGGSLAPLEYASAFSDITKKRLAELEARLAQHSTQPGSTPGRGGR